MFVLCLLFTMARAWEDSWEYHFEFETTDLEIATIQIEKPGGGAEATQVEQVGGAEATQVDKAGRGAEATQVEQVGEAAEATQVEKDAGGGGATQAEQVAGGAEASQVQGWRRSRSHHTFTTSKPSHIQGQCKQRSYQVLCLRHLGDQRLPKQGNHTKLAIDARQFCGFTCWHWQRVVEVRNGRRHRWLAMSVGNRW